MAVTIYYEADCKPEVIQNMKIAIIGYGSQGHAHALNLLDSGCDVRVGLREGSKSREAAEAKALEVASELEKSKLREAAMVGTFPDGRSALMLVTARPKYVAESSWGSRRYLDVTLLDE